MIYSEIAAVAARTPDATAVYYNDEPISYAQFVHDIQKVAVWLAASGPIEGPTAGLCIRDTYVAWLFVFALNIHGVDSFAIPSTACDYACLDVKAIFYDHTRGLDPHDTKKRLVLAPSLAVLQAVELGSFDAGTPPSGRIYLSTSGTTGSYKFIAYDLASARAVAASIGLAENDVHHYVYFGMWTAAGTMRLVAAWFVGLPVIIDLRPDALEHLFRRRFTQLPLTLPLVETIASLGLSLPPGAENPRVLVGGGPCSREALREARRVFGRGVRVTYACTEISSLPILESSAEETEDMRVFYPRRDRHIEIVDEGGQARAVGEVGRLRIRLQPGDATEYVNNPEATALAFRDGWFYPGDLAILQSDGSVRILGRQDDVIVIDGSKYAVGPLEDKLATDVGAEVACIFTHTRADGEIVLLAALQGSDLDANAISAVLAGCFPSFADRRWKTFDAFPQRGIGKTDRAALRKALEAEYDAR